jgi:hypothetical protein
MTDEEIRRFALQLREAERVRALIEQDAAAMDGVPSATEPPVEETGPDLCGEMTLPKSA